MAYQQEDSCGKLHEQLENSRQILLKTLTVEQFADWIAQTVCYSLFTAKYSAVEYAFSRSTVIHFLPKTNPFLHSLFNQFMGVEANEQWVGIIDNLITLLNKSDIKAILEDFSKQEDNLTCFYETFLAHYDAKLRKGRGVYYTPQPVVSYIVRSIDWVLKEKFNLKEGLADNNKIDGITHKVQILDPATGTGTFLSAVIAEIYAQFQKNQGMWPDYVRNHLLPRLYGFELLPAAYTIAHLKLSLQLQETGYHFDDKEYLQIFLTNALEETHNREKMPLARELSREATITERESPVLVILGNPPYSGHSTNTGTWINNLLHGISDDTNYFQVDGKPLNERNPKWLNDDYVKFIRFSQWRIKKTGYGVLGLVTNHAYLDNPTFRGMRHALLQDFNEIYILDLHGNSKKRDCSFQGGLDQNVFDIRQGVAIGIFINYQGKKSDYPKVYHAHLFGRRDFKYSYLLENAIQTTKWVELKPQSPFYLFVPQNLDLMADYQRGWKITEAMPIHSVGVVTARDHLTIQTSVQQVLDVVTDFYQLPTEKARTKYQLRQDVRDWKVHFAQNDLKQQKLEKSKVVPILYRPFDVRFTFYTGRENGFICRPRKNVMRHVLEGENLGLITIRRSRRPGSWKEVFVSNCIIAGATSISALDMSYFFPLYLYPTEKKDLFTPLKDKITRKPNFSAEFIKDLEKRLNLLFIPEGHGDFNITVSALNVFYYIYAVFYSPTYRQRYVEFLKMDFPRLPLTRNRDLFKQLSQFGERLVEIHLMKVPIENRRCFPIQGNNLVEKIVYQQNKVFINKTQYFGNVVREIWEFQFGGYQICQKWLTDRKGHVLNFAECSRYLYILAAVEETRELMEKIDETISVFPLL